MRTTSAGIRALAIGLAAAVAFTVAPHQARADETTPAKDQTIVVIPDATLDQALTEIDKLPEVKAATTAAESAGALPRNALKDSKKLKAETISTYSKYMIPKGDGTVKISIPAEFYFTDPSGAWAATRTAIRSNTAVSQQLAAMHAAGQSVEMKEYVYGQAIPMGQHANFTPLWWGMEFHFDAYAAQGIEKFIVGTQKAMSLVDLLKSFGVIIAPEVGVVLNLITLGLKAILNKVQESITVDGIVIKSLWIPIPWVEKPTGPFVPALPLSQIKGKNFKPTAEPLASQAPAPAPAN